MREKELSCNPYSIDTKNVTQTLICSSVESSYIQKYIKKIIKSCNTIHADDIKHDDVDLSPSGIFRSCSFPLHKCKQFNTRSCENNEKTEECYRLNIK